MLGFQIPVGTTHLNGHDFGWTRYKVEMDFTNRTCMEYKTFGECEILLDPTPLNGIYHGGDLICGPC